MADASEEFRRLLVETLRGEGDLSVVGETGDGEAAVELCRQRQCDVLVMDMILASLDGVEVLSKVSAMTPKPKVLVISSFASGSVADLAAAKGADYFMMKPCRTSAVVERVRQMVYHTLFADRCRISIAQLGNSAGIIGAAGLAMS